MNGKCCYNTTCHRTGMQCLQLEPTANQIRKSLGTTSGGSAVAVPTLDERGKEEYDDDFADAPDVADSRTLAHASS